MEWFSFVMPVTGLNRPNTGKEDDDVKGCSQLSGFENKCEIIHRN
jgi:hypothetical protein